MRYNQINVLNENDVDVAEGQKEMKGVSNATWTRLGPQPYPRDLRKEIHPTPPSFFILTTITFKKCIV